MDQADGVPVLDGQSSPPLPSQQSRPRLGLFQSSDESLPWEQEGTPDLFPPDAGSPSESAWSGDAPGEGNEEDPTSSPSPSDDPGRSPLTKRALKATIRRSVITSASVAHKFGARTPGQQHVGLYLVDEDDVEGISDPLASIAQRRGGIAGKLSPDHADGIAALMAFGGYVAKQFHNIQAAKEIDAQAPPAGVEQ